MSKFDAFLANFSSYLPHMLYISYFMWIFYQKPFKAYKIAIHGFIGTFCFASWSAIFFALDNNRLLTPFSLYITMFGFLAVTLGYFSFMVKSFSLKSSSLLLILFTLSGAISNILFSLSYSSNSLEHLPTLYRYILIGFILTPICAIPFFLLLQKINFQNAFALLFGSKKQSFITFFISLFLFFFQDIIALFFPALAQDYFLLIQSIILIVSFCSLAFLAFYQQTQEKLAKQETLLLQQAEHMRTLETIQKDMQLLQQNYNSMVADLHLQENTDDTSEIEAYVGAALQHVDASLEIKSKQSMQLKNIEIPSLKNFLFSKLIEIETLKIPFNLHIKKVINDIALDTNKLTTCLTILLDNAIEATKFLEHPQPISLSISNDNGTVSIHVTNTTMENLPLHKIWDKGFSTKEAHTGLGLFNLQEIINTYTNIVKQTFYTDNIFTQIITINKLK